MRGEYQIRPGERGQGRSWRTQEKVMFQDLTLNPLNPAAPRPSRCGPGQVGARVLAVAGGSHDLTVEFLLREGAVQPLPPGARLVHTEHHACSLQSATLVSLYAH